MDSGNVDRQPNRQLGDSMQSAMTSNIPIWQICSIRIHDDSVSNHDVSIDLSDFAAAEKTGLRRFMQIAALESDSRSDGKTHRNLADPSNGIISEPGDRRYLSKKPSGVKKHHVFVVKETSLAQCAERRALQVCLRQLRSARVSLSLQCPVRFLFPPRLLQSSVSQNGAR